MRHFRRLVVCCAIALPYPLPANAARPPLGGERVTGSYSFQRDDGSVGEIEILMLSATRLKVGISLTEYRGRQTPNLGEGISEAALRGSTAIYKDASFPECKITIEFLPGNALSAAQEGDCGFGNGVTADDMYFKVSGRKPSFSGLGPPPAPDPNALGAAAVEDKRQAMSAPDTVESRRARIATLTAQRQSALAQIAAKRADFDKHSRAGADAAKRAPKANATSKPSAADLTRTAQHEYQVASTLGDELLKATSALRADEEELGQLVAEVTQAATDAKGAASDVAKGLGKLSALANANSDQATKAALAAEQAAGKARAALGVSLLDALSAQREKDRKDDDALAAELAADRAALSAVDAALKNARARTK
jgi:hypothetical protein